MTKAQASRALRAAALAVLLAVAAVHTSGCKRVTESLREKAAREKAAETKTAAATPAPVAAAPEGPSPAEMARLESLADDELARANQQAGLGLGLKVRGSSFHQGERYPLHILIEDFAATKPIAADLCLGFQMNLENLADHGVITSDVHAITCDDPSKFYIYREPLVKNKMVTFDVMQHNEFDAPIPPGNYRMTLTWQAYPTARKADMLPVPYSVLTSNPIAITMLPPLNPPPASLDDPDPK